MGRPQMKGNQERDLSQVRGERGRDSGVLPHVRVAPARGWTVRLRAPPAAQARAALARHARRRGRGSRGGDCVDPGRECAVTRDRGHRRERHRGPADVCTGDCRLARPHRCLDDRVCNRSARTRAEPRQTRLPQPLASEAFLASASSIRVVSRAFILATGRSSQVSTKPNPTRTARCSKPARSSRRPTSSVFRPELPGVRCFPGQRSCRVCNRIGFRL